jgi:hypothetical protein
MAKPLPKILMITVYDIEYTKIINIHINEYTCIYTYTFIYMNICINMQLCKFM